MDFLTLIGAIKTAVALMPVLAEVITAAEGFFPAKGSGVQKLELVKTILQSSYGAASKASEPFETLWPILSSVITHAAPIITAKCSELTPTDNTQ